MKEITLQSWKKSEPQNKIRKNSINVALYFIEEKLFRSNHVRMIVIIFFSGEAWMANGANLVITTLKS